MEPAISLASLATFSILFSVVRPTLPYWGYVWCRFSDFLAISIVLFSLLMHPKFRKDALNDSTVVSMSFWTILYILVILISIFSNALLFDFSLKNLVEITRPIILCSCFLFGYFYVDEKRLSFNFFLKTLVAIAFLNVTVGVLQLLELLRRLFGRLHVLVGMILRARARSALFFSARDASGAPPREP